MIKSVNIELPRSLYLNMQRDSQWQYIQVGHHNHVGDMRNRVSCLRNTTGWNSDFISIHLSGYGGVQPQDKFIIQSTDWVHNSHTD